MNVGVVSLMMKINAGLYVYMCVCVYIHFTYITVAQYEKDYEKQTEKN